MDIFFYFTVNVLPLMYRVVCTVYLRSGQVPKGKYFTSSLVLPQDTSCLPLFQWSTSFSPVEIRLCYLLIIIHLVHTIDSI